MFHEPVNKIEAEKSGKGKYCKSAERGGIRIAAVHRETKKGKNKGRPWKDGVLKPNGQKEDVVEPMKGAGPRRMGSVKRKKKMSWHFRLGHHGLRVHEEGNKSRGAFVAQGAQG